VLAPEDLRAAMANAAAGMARLYAPSAAAAGSGIQ
jgi:hypothetical protein